MAQWSTQDGPNADPASWVLSVWSLHVLPCLLEMMLIILTCFAKKTLDDVDMSTGNVFPEQEGQDHTLFMQSAGLRHRKGRERERLWFQFIHPVSSFKSLLIFSI